MPRESLSHGDREQALARLASVLRGLESRRPEFRGTGAEELPRMAGGGGGADPRVGAGGVPTGWPGIDALGGLSRGLLHEWFGVAEPESSAGPESEGRLRPRRNPAWTPPLRLLAALAARALAARSGGSGGAGGAGGAGGWVCWIGSKVWPYPRALIPREQVSIFESACAEPVGEGDDVETSRANRRSGASVVPVSSDRVSSDLLASSLFIDPPDDAVRLWAIDLAIRCPALAAVVADGRGLTMPASRRLQLAAEKSVAAAGHGPAGGGPLVLLARPPSERGMPSVAGTRWLVEREAGASSTSATTANPRWCVEVLRWKGRGSASPSGLSVGAASEVGRRWSLEWSHVEGVVVESPVVADGSRAAEGRPPNPGPPGASPVVAGRSSEFLETRVPHDDADRPDGIGGRAAAG